MPFITDESLESLNLSFNKLLTWFLDDRSLYLELDGDHRPNEISMHLSTNFQLISQYKINKEKKIKYQPELFLKENFDNINDSDYKNLILDIYNFVNKNLTEYISSFVLHGSLATFDFSKGWSDVDTFVIIKNSTLLSSNKLLKFRSQCLELKKLFYKICPLQHHGLIVFSEEDMERYSSNFIPHEVLRSSIQLLDGAKELKLKVEAKCDEKNELQNIKRIKSLRKEINKAIKHGKLCHHPYKRECLENNFKNANNAMRQMFWFSGNIMTMPAYLLTGIGESCEKKYSFKKTADLFSAESLELINRVSEIRLKWQEKEGIYYKGNIIPIWFQEILGNHYFERFRNL